MKTNKPIHKLIYGITLGLPMIVYLLVSAIVFQVVPDYEIHVEDIEQVVVIGNFVGVKENAKLKGTFTYNEEYELWGFTATEESVILINKQLYTYEDTQLVEAKRKLIEKEQSWKIPLSVYISLGGGLIVALVIMGKMQIHKQYPRIATLIALGLGTAILGLINLLITNIFHVFLIATISWAIYLLEYSIIQRNINREKTKSTSDELENALRDALRNG